MKKIKKLLRKVSIVKKMNIVLNTIKHRYSLPTRITALVSFFSDYRKYQRLNENGDFSLKTEDLYPRLFDKTAMTGVDPVYFYQDAWCAKKIFETKPSHHVDIGSHLPTIGIISQFVPTTMVDIRPLTVTLPGLSFTEGSILDLPFKDGEVASLSSICVIEHIGLGRYGDPLDQFGSEKAAAELSRVLAPGGSLYISVPIDSENKVYFNAHRAFTREYILKLFETLKKGEEKYIYRHELCDTYDPIRGFGTGLFWFKK
jgi:SAM-dependent methyltransferase